MYFTKSLTALVFTSILLSPFTNAIDKKSSSKVVATNEVQWGYLNPLRGNKSPGAANLWGDRTKNVATGMLVKFNKGFSSPPHIHNISYRGIVIQGMMHNDGPNSEKMWMSTGSFWTQPAGENHITAANGENNLIYLEIDNGPYLVKPSSESFNNGEAPVNLHQSNMVWLNHNDLKFIDGKSAEVTMLWGSSKEDEVRGEMIRFSAGFNGEVKTDAKEFRAVIIQGQVTYSSSERNSAKRLSPGSYFSSSGGF